MYLSKYKLMVFSLVRVIGHCFFMAGLVLMVIFAKSKTAPIYLDELEMIKVLSCFLLGYVCVFVEWFKLANSDELYSGDADSVPGYLTEKLFGIYPYLFTWGKKNSSNGNTRYKWHKYSNEGGCK
jgi:hypothetical protein